MHAPRSTRAVARPRRRQRQHAHEPRRRRSLLGASLALGASLLLACSIGAGAARGATTTTTAVDAATVAPSEFVPNWDGHTDTAVLSYRLAVRSRVTVRVLDVRSRVVARIDSGIRDAGVHRAVWDGRIDAGKGRSSRVAAPGAYRLRVDARPMAASAVAGGVRAATATTRAVAGARAATVTVKRPAVTLTSVQLTRTAVGRARGTQQTGARYRLSAPASVSAAVVDSGGRVVRSLASGRVRAGANNVVWNGRVRDGAWASDGEYAIVIAATGGGHPTRTQRLPITVDRSVPELKVPASVRAGLVGGSAASVRVPLAVTASEAGTLTVRHGSRAHDQRIASSGRTRVVVDGARIGLVASAKARTVRLSLQFRDAAGNVRVRAVRVQVPARRAAVTNPTPPPVSDPVDPGAVQPTGSWPWPVAGIVTSEFGLRDGRPHEGIDIAIATGTPIHPSRVGTIAFVGSYGGYGNLVIVDHGDGLTTRYAHMSRYGGFAVGDRVAPGDVIGYVGCTGSCTGPHLHFEVRTGERARNPRAYLVAR